MSFKTEIKAIAYSRLLASANPGPGQSVPEAVRASMESQANDIAEAVANSIHSSYVTQVNAFCDSVGQLAATLNDWIPGALDSGGPQKAAAAAAALALIGAAAALKEKGVAYNG